jgi:hypothetical protein
MREFECEIDHEEELQAFYRCEHGLWAFSDKSEDCQCQTQFYKTAQQIPTGGNNKLLETTKKPIAPSSSESFSTLRSIASQSRLNNQQQQQQQIKPTHIPNRFDTIYEGKEQPYC